MSRIGYKIIKKPEKAKIEIRENSVLVEGPKGKLESPLFEGITVVEKDGNIQVNRADDSKELKARHGLVRSLINNSVIGVIDGFSKSLVLNGVGYKANLKGNVLILNLGYSHEIQYKIPDDIKIEVKDSTKVLVQGISKQRVGQIAAEIREYRKPEPYKGKGVRYDDEVIRRKAGKAGKS